MIACHSCREHEADLWAPWKAHRPYKGISRPTATRPAALQSGRWLRIGTVNRGKNSICDEIHLPCREYRRGQLGAFQNSVLAPRVCRATPLDIEKESARNQSIGWASGRSFHL